MIVCEMMMGVIDFGYVDFVVVVWRLFWILQMEVKRTQPVNI